MTLQRKSSRVLMGAALLALTAGCSGLRASKSVSPLDFLMPGGGLMRNLLYHQPPAAPPDPAVEPGTPAATAAVAPVS